MDVLIQACVGPGIYVMKIRWQEFYLEAVKTADMTWPFQSVKGASTFMNVHSPVFHPVFGSD